MLFRSPDSFAKKTNASDFIDYIAKKSTDFIRFKTNLLLEDAGNDPVKRAGLITDIVRSISLIPGQIIRAEYVKECSTLLNVSEQILYHEINKLKGQEREKQFNRQKQEEEKAAPANVPQDLPPSFGITQKFEKEERELLQMLIKYGNHTLYTDTENNITKTAAAYIIEELELDELRLEQPLHRFIVEEYKLYINDKNFDSEHYFLHHSNKEVSLLTADLITEEHTLSKVHSKNKKIKSDSERLTELVPKAVLGLKNSIIIEKVREKLLLLKQANEEKNLELIAEIMQEMSRLEVVRIQLSKTLGERIIIKL